MELMYANSRAMEVGPSPTESQMLPEHLSSATTIDSGPVAIVVWNSTILPLKRSGLFIKSQSVVLIGSSAFTWANPKTGSTASEMATTARTSVVIRFLCYNGSVDDDGIFLSGVLPELANQLERLLKVEGEHELAAQVQGLRIVDRCRCGDDFCATFYVQPKPVGSFGPTHRNVTLEPEQGMLILDVENAKIACIEVLYLDDIRRKLETLLP
jgi:hypothetical protein